MNPAPKWPELTDVGHNHLVRQPQPRGECLACDLTIWEPQDARLAAIKTPIEGPTWRPGPALDPDVPCTAEKPINLRAPNPSKCHHTCERPKGHPQLHHRCRECRLIWRES